MDEELNNETMEEGEGDPSCKSCLHSYHPDFRSELDKSASEQGAKAASFLTGFAGALNQFGLSEATIANIILNKIALEYQQEMLRMKLEADEHIAVIYAKSPIKIVNED